MGIIFKKPQGGSGSGVNVGISKGQFLATENQTTFVIQNTISENDLLMIHVNNLFLEKDINYSMSEDSVSGTTTIALPSLKLDDIVSWILIKVGDTSITPEIKKAICGEFLCGELLCGEGLNSVTTNDDYYSIGNKSLEEISVLETKISTLPSWEDGITLLNAENLNRMVKKINELENSLTTKTWFGTQIEYDALEVKDQSTIYYIIAEE